ncbi:MAG: hypothetical protein PHU05_03890 [Bacilli bacterium]|nr:hypothetical protein [Bacilli bacterium]
MKRIFHSLLALFVFIVVMQALFNYFSKGYSLEYTFFNDTNEFEIKEVYTANVKNEKDNYYFEIKAGENVFSFQVFDSFLKKKKIIEDIRYYKDSEYECIYPIFIDDTIIFDVTCMHKGVLYEVSQNETNDKVKEFVKNLNNYDYTRWQSREDKTKEFGHIKAYTGNLEKNHYIGISSYKGTYTINTQNNLIGFVKDVPIFKKDVYKYPLSTYVGQYYVVADYDSVQVFNNFNTVDLTTNKIDKIFSNHQISYDSYILGVYENSIYLYDQMYKKEYEIDVDAKTILEVGNETTKIKVLENGVWNRYSPSEIKNNDKTFINYPTTSIKNVTKIEMGNVLSGYSYFLEENKKSEYKYKVYRSNIQNPEQKTYLFEIDSFDDMYFVDDYIYYRNGKSIYSYSIKSGKKLILTNSELTFNTYIKFGAYIK